MQGWSNLTVGGDARLLCVFSGQQPGRVVRTRRRDCLGGVTAVGGPPGCPAGCDRLDGASLAKRGRAMSDDLFGLERELKIQRSGVRDVFTPHQPIQAVELFFGRQKEVQKLLEQINTPGQHALLYGERGVGKSSLANIATQVLIKQIIKGKLYPKRCDSNDTFRSMTAPVLTDLGVEVDLESLTKVQRRHGQGGLKIPVVEAGFGAESETEKNYRPQQFTPSVVAEFLKDKHGLLYIDEADRVQALEDKIALAELIKLLSDTASPFQDYRGRCCGDCRGAHRWTPIRAEVPEGDASQANARQRARTYRHGGCAKGRADV